MKGHLAHIFRSTERWRDGLPLALVSLDMLLRVHGGADHVDIARTMNLAADIHESLDELKVQRRMHGVWWWCVCVALCGFVALHGFVWLCVALCGFVWPCVALRGFAWLCVALCGAVWRCVELFGVV